MAKGAYIGVAMELPIYSEQTTNASINDSNIRTFFSVSHGSYGFYDSGNTGTFTTNNAAVNSGVAQTTLTALSDTIVSFSYSYSSEPNYDKFTLTVAGTTIENAVSGATTTKSYSGSVAKGQQIVFKYAKDSSVNKNDDKCTFSNMKVTATVKTQIGSETRSIANKVKKGYVGVDGIARKIIKAYIGIGGVARPCWSTGLVNYYGTIDSLSIPRMDSSPGKVGDYALFAGGYIGMADRTNSVEVYNATLTKMTAPNLDTARSSAASTSVGDYAIFAGGYVTSVVGAATVDAYNQSLTKITINQLGTRLSRVCATTVKNHALFAGGFYYSTNSNPSYEVDTITVYDDSLTKSVMSTRLPEEESRLAGATVGNYAIFGCYTWFVAYNELLTQVMLDSSGLNTNNSSALTAGKYAIFTGGEKVTVFDATLTKTSATNLTYSSVRTKTTLENYAIFQVINTTDKILVMDVYDSNLIKTNIDPTSDHSAYYTAVTIGDYAIFAGSNLDAGSSVTDIYTIL